MPSLVGRPGSLVESQLTSHFGFSWSRQNGEISQQLFPRGEHLIPRCNQLPGPRNPEARELQQKVFRLGITRSVDGEALSSRVGLVARLDASYSVVGLRFQVEGTDLKRDWLA